MRRRGPVSRPAPNRDPRNNPPATTRVHMGALSAPMCTFDLRCGQPPTRFMAAKTCSTSAGFQGG